MRSRILARVVAFLGAVAALLAQTTPKTWDVKIHLYRSRTTTQERAPYEEILRHFNRGVFESSNGAHRIGKIMIYTKSRPSDTDVEWVASCWPSSPPKGRGQGGSINFCDVFTAANDLDFLTNQAAGGYTLAHEWGHLFYGLYDEYVGTDTANDSTDYMPHTTDVGVPDSIMNCERCGGWAWLNFSTDQNNPAPANNVTPTNAQRRVYGASGWGTLIRNPKDDSKRARDLFGYSRVLYSELAAVAPALTDLPKKDLDTTTPDAPRILWMDDTVTYQIVLDRSGSMSFEPNKMANARLGASLLIDMAEINKARVGVIAFDNLIEVIQPITLIDSEQTKQSIKQAIGTIQPRNTTAIGEAAARALADIQVLGTTDSTRVVFLLTNGQSNTGRDPLSVIPDYKAASVPIYTFAYGSDANASILRRMAEETGGKLYISPTTLQQVTQAFADASRQATGAGGVTTGSAVVTSASPLSASLVVDPSMSRINVMLTFQGTASSVTASLNGPGGAVITISNCTAVGSETLCYAEVNQPAAGGWTLSARPTGAPVNLRYEVSGNSTGKYMATVHSMKGSAVTYPAPIVVGAQVRGMWPMTGVGVRATIQAPDGTARSITLRDDGVAPDQVAGDGLYSGILDYSSNGTHIITVQFDNSAATARMSPLSYSPSRPPFGGNWPPALVPVAENFTRFAQIQVEVGGVRADDHVNVMSGATVAAPDNSSVAGRIEYTGDLDVFRVNPAANGNLVFRVTNLAFNMDPRLRLFDAAGRTLAEGDLVTAGSGSGYVAIPVPVRVGIPLYAEVSDRRGAPGGTYALSAGGLIVSDQAQAAAVSPPAARLVTGADMLTFTTSVLNPTQSIRLSLSGEPQEVSYTTVSSAPWLAASPPAGRTGGDVLVTANSSGLAPGRYSAVLTFLSSAGSASVTAQLTVLGAPELIATPPSVRLTAAVGGPAPAPVAVVVTSKNVNVNFTVATSTSWIEVNQLQPGTPAIVNIGVRTASLQPGVYDGVVVLTGTGVSGDPLRVPVTLTVVGITPQIRNQGILNAASLQPGPAAPGSLILIRGSNLARSSEAAAGVPHPTSLAGASVTIGGLAASLSLAGPGELRAQVPYGVRPGAANVIVTVGGVSSPAFGLEIAEAAPGILVRNDRAFALNEDGSENTAANPARAGSELCLYLTGYGLVDPLVETGAAAPESPVAKPVLPVTATLGGEPVAVLSATLAPGLVGILEVRITAPDREPQDHVLNVNVGPYQSNSALVSVGRR